MFSLVLHLVVVASGMGLLAAGEVFPPLADLTWWWLIPLFALGPILNRSPLRAPQILALVSPVLVQFAFQFLSDFTSQPFVISSPAGWFGLADLTSLMPLIIAHLLACTRRDQGLFDRTNLMARMAFFTWGIVGLYLGLSTLGSQWKTPRIWLEESSLATLAFSSATLVCLAIVVPRMLLFLLPTQRLGQPYEGVAGEVAADLGVSPPRLLEWETGGTISNALVLSMTGGPRPVLFTDAFIASLGLAEFRAVVAHELGHVAGRHVSTLATFMVGAALSMDLLLVSIGNETVEVIAAFGFIASLLVCVGFISRRVELEADLFALEATGDSRGLELALLRATGFRVKKKGWRHFSTARRIIFLRAAAHDEGVGQRLRKNVRLFRSGALLLLAFGLLGTLYSCTRSIPVENFWMDVRRANLSLAHVRLDSLDPSELALSGQFEIEDLKQAINLGDQLQVAGESLSTNNLGRLALAALPAEPARARHLLDLATLIGDADSMGLRRGLDQAEDLPPIWRQVALKITELP